jgi:hypothetical protein
MSIRKVLAETAGNVAQQMASQRIHLQQELSEIERRKTEVEAKLYAANLAFNRLSAFELELRGHLQCPRCWIEAGVHANVIGIGGAADQQGLFQCASGHDFACGAVPG